LPGQDCVCGVLSWIVPYSLFYQGNIIGARGENRVKT
jgi:hypothetical protein